jgi:hypothetical protein
MNVGFGSHFAQDVLEQYSLGMLSEDGCADLEGHLLTCPHCQTQLEEADKYVSVIRSACVLTVSKSQGIPKARGMQFAEFL